MIPLLKTDFSIGRSIIQLSRISDGTPNKPDQPDTVRDMAEEFSWKKIYLCENNLGGFVPAYKEAKKVKAQLCFGWIVSIVEDASKKEDQPSSKVTIWVKSEAGWKSLVKIATKAQVAHSFNGQTRTDWKTLQEHWTDELVLGIPFYDSFLHVNSCSKNAVVPDFGSIRPYIFVENNDVFFDGMLREKALEFAKAYGFPVVEAKTCYYKNRADLIFFQARKLMDRKTFGGGTVEEPNMEYFASNEFCVESYLENKDKVGSGEAAFDKEFDKPLELFLPGVRLPEFKLDEEDRKEYKIKKGATNIEILRTLARHGYKEKMEAGYIDKARSEEYGKRFEYELDMLEKTSFDSYILLVWDTTRFAIKNNLAHGFGRGSSAGSLINYLIGIVDVDPVVEGLYFERFISLSRAKTEVIDGVKYLAGSLCDIDCDYGAEARDRVIEYLSSKYPGKFAKLSTYNTQTTKALMKDAGKVIGCFSEDQMKFFSDEVPVKFGKVAKPEEAYEASEILKGFCDENPIVFGCVKKLQNCIKNFGSHASAYIISFNNLDEFMPLQYGTDGEVVTSADAEVTELTTIKLDLLGLQSVTLFDNVVKALDIDINAIDYTSWDKIYKFLQNLEAPTGLFQISGSAAVRGSNKIKPKTKDDLSAVLAICRPGSFVFLDQYADYINGKGEKPSLHPLFDDILEKTAGVMLYQESLMAMFVKVGFSLSEADDIRRVVGKKKVEEMAQWESKIYEKCKENGHDIGAAKALWKVAEMSADYSFNKSHSVAYAKLTALSVYLKFNHPQNFFLELLRLSKDKQDQAAEVAAIVQELPYFEIKLLPPSLTKSDRDFKIEGKDIRFGLEAIKGISEKSIAHLQSFINKEKTNLFEVFQAAQQSKVNATVIGALIEVGVLEDVSEFDRQETVLFSKIWKELTAREQSYCLRNGAEFNWNLREMVKNYMAWTGPDGKAIAKESRFQTIKKNCQPALKLWAENSKNKDISQYLFEKKLLGYCPSFTIAELFTEFDELQTTYQIKFELYEKDNVKLAAEVKEVKTGVAKKSGNKYAKITFTDETGTMEGLFTGKKWADYLARHGEPQEGQLVHVQGVKGPGDDAVIFIDKLDVQALSIFSRVSDLKRYQEKAGIEEKVIDITD